MAISLNNDILITTDDAAKILSIPAATLTKWRSTGQNNIPFVKIGRAVRYRTKDLREWLDKNSRT